MTAPFKFVGIENNMAAYLHRGSEDVYPLLSRNTGPKGSNLNKGASSFPCQIIVQPFTVPIIFQVYRTICFACFEKHHEVTGMVSFCL